MDGRRKECKLESTRGIFTRRMTKTSKLDRAKGKYACAVNRFAARWRSVARSWNAVSANRCLTKKVCVNRVLLRSRCRSNYGPFIRQSTRCLNENKRWEKCFMYRTILRDSPSLPFLSLIWKTSTCQMRSYYFFLSTEKHRSHWSLPI